MRSRQILLAFLLVAAGVYLRFRQGSDALDAPALLTQVRRMNQLTTVRYTMQKIVTLEQQSSVVSSERLMLVMQATVEAGIDLSGLKAEGIERRADGALIVRLPPPRITNLSIDEKETKVWDRTKTWWAPWVPYSLDLEKNARIQGLAAVRQGALDSGILRQAERQAEVSIRGLLSLVGVREVVLIPASSS